MATKLGELLVQNKLITTSQLKKAIEEQHRFGGKIGSNLTRLGYISDLQLVEFLGHQFKLPHVTLSEFKIDKSILSLIPVDLAAKYLIFPVKKIGNTLVIAMSDPSDQEAVDMVKQNTKCDVEIVITTLPEINQAISSHYGSAVTYEEVFSDIEEQMDKVSVEVEGLDANVLEIGRNTQAAPVIKLVNLIISDAIKKQASDIHIEPSETKLSVRYRIDGVMYEVLTPPVHLKAPVVARLKIMSKLDISEKRLPQDGRIKLRVGSKEVDFRVSTIPTLYGEKIVLRILDKTSVELNLEKLGFEEKQLVQFRDGIHKPNGMVLITGPTGSGKTTTLYAALTELNQGNKNITTIEDPIEYNIAGINQVQVIEEIGLTFAHALRAFLRQDPDIILVGEIRDAETAEIAIKSAMTGHLVLSTLHTNDAPSSINRLIQMGIEPFLITSSINIIAAQRLIRKICDHCKKSEMISDDKLHSIGIDPKLVKNMMFYHGCGCDNCNNTGYKGRVAIYEVMPYTSEIKELSLDKSYSGRLKEMAIKQGMKTLKQSAIQKLLQGVTSFEEILQLSIES